MNKKSIDEYQEKPASTIEFLKDILSRSQKNISNIQKIKKEIENDARRGLSNEDQ